MLLVDGQSQLKQQSKSASTLLDSVMCGKHCAVEFDTAACSVLADDLEA